jgi:hypothetical protein
MLHHHALVAEDGDAGNGVHILGVQEVNELRQIVDIHLVLAEQRMLERNVHAAVGILDIEDHGVAANFAPVANDANSVIAGRHDAGQVDRADFKILGHGNCFLDDGRGENSRNGDLLARFQQVTRAVPIRAADRLREFG